MHLQSLQVSSDETLPLCPTSSYSEQLPYHSAGNRQVAWPPTQVFDLLFQPVAHCATPIL